jgi:hypothetical protein
LAVRANCCVPQAGNSLSRLCLPSSVALARCSEARLSKDMSRFLRAGLLALHPARRINQRFPKECASDQESSTTNPLFFSSMPEFDDRSSTSSCGVWRWAKWCSSHSHICGPESVAVPAASQTGEIQRERGRRIHCAGDCCRRRRALPSVCHQPRGCCFASPRMVSGGTSHG